jgi:hypothetical protein
MTIVLKFYYYDRQKRPLITNHEILITKSDSRKLGALECQRPLITNHEILITKSDSQSLPVAKLLVPI